MTETATTTATFVAEYSYEATTLDYLSPRWYQFETEEPFASLAEAEAFVAAKQAERVEAGNFEPLAMRAREVPPPVETDWDAVDAMWSQRYWADRAASSRAAEANEQALRAEFAKGTKVKVVKGRKVPVGTEGEVFWVGEGKWGWRVGFTGTDGETYWTALTNVEAVAA